jgi:ADP-ribose pyrophosphatase YjhB (NUDIX family)
MSVRSRIADRPTPSVEVAKTYGTNVPASFQQGEIASQMTPASPFSPGEPIGPYDGYDRNPRAFNYTTGYNISTRPRLHERVSFEVLQGLIGAYDVADICIWHRIDSIRSLKWKLLAAEHYFGDVTDAVPLGLAALKKPDRKTHFKTWLAKYAYDILAYDAGTLYRMRNRAGRCVGLKVVDGTTIAPLLDYWGDPPDPPAESHVQYVNGLPWNWLTRDDIIYEPFRPRPNSPYGHAPIESIILNANTDLRFQIYFLQRFTEGNLPAAFASSPDSWSPDQIEQFQAYWDSFMYGDQSRKAQIRWMPPGSKFEWSNEKDFTDTFSLFLMRKTCASFHVVPSDLGFTEDVNRSSGESQADVQHRVGDLPFMEHLEGILSAFLLDDLGLPLKFEFDRGEEQVDQLAQAQADQAYIDRAVVSPSEIREMRYGLTDSEPVPRAYFSERAGPIPLISLLSVAGPIDPQTAAPPAGTKLPHKAFTVVEGVVTNPPLIGEPLAEQEYGPSAMPPQAAPQPVAKEGEAAPGITSDTGLYGDPLIRDDDDEQGHAVISGHVITEDEARQAAREAVKKELADFRGHRYRRRKAGRWSDFEFRAVDPVRGHNLNDSGRLAVRKAAGEIGVAGLAVLAADTGRVLMLQRALCDDDPAAGTWEFAGGHLEGGETPLAAAWREWAEECHAVPPPGVQTGSWTSSSGIYQGIVWTAESEAMVPVRSAAEITNPDDPDGDQVEAIAWWNPADLPGNPAIRSELLADMPAVMAALGCTPDCCGGECCQGDGGCCGGSGGCPCGPSAVAKCAFCPECGGDMDDSGRCMDWLDYGQQVRERLGADGTQGDAQDVPHQSDDHGHRACAICGLTHGEGAVAKAADAGPKAPMLDTRNLTGVWAEVYGRRNKLLATHTRAVAAAWDACIAELGSPRSAVQSFRSEARIVAKLADPDRPWWKDAGTAAALAWLQGLDQTKGYPALVAALEAAIADGMAEGEADALALAADRLGRTGFAIGKAFTAALARLQGDPDVSQQAGDAAAAMAGSAAGDIGSVLADQAGDDGSDDEMTDAASDAAAGSQSQAVQTGTDWRLYAAILAGALALYQRAMSRTPAPTAPGEPPQEPPPTAAKILLDWITAGDDLVCATCDGFADNGPYAPDDVPGYPHPRCRCSVGEHGSMTSPFLIALLDSLT